MAPTFKKSKDYDAALASNTLGSPIHAAPRNLTYKEAATGASTTKPAGDEPDDSRALLIALGLAEAEEADPVEAQPQPAPRKQAPPQLEATGSGQIGAFYPKEGTCTTVPAGSNAYDALRARLEALTVKLMQGRLGDADSDEVQGLLLDQQHQIDLLLRGQSSLRGSMNNMRRSTMEKDAQTKELHQQLEQQHGAALREMESKLEKAIEQVQQLQLTSRDRQRQQTASLPHSLKSASEESSQLRGKADALQAALDSKEQELQAAQQHQEGLEAQLVQARSALEAQRASFKQQLQSLAADCQAALADVQTKAAALTAAQAESQQLSQQLDEAAVLQQHLTGLSEQLQAQVKQAAAVAQQQQAESAAQKQELLAQIQQLQRDLQATSTAQEQGKQETQVLQQQCRDLGASLAESRAEVQELQAQLAAANKQQASVSDESAGVRQELAAAVQAKTDLTLQLEDATTTIRQLQVQQQQAEAALQSLKQQEAASVANKAAGMQEQQALQRQVQELEAQCKQGTEQAAKLEAELAQVQEQLQAAEQQAQDNSTKITAAESDSQQLQFKLAALQTELQKVQRTSSATIQQLRQEADDARQQLSTVKRLTDKQIAKAQAAAQQEVDQFRQRWRHEFERRRKLHNQVIELKGNIRVLARIRPMIEKERSAACSEGGGVQEAVRALDEETVVLDAANGPREFSFDRVFGPSDGQSAVYDEVSGIVTSIMDGYNACIMAYGQTGSGKTFTLEGPADDPGVNSRALAELFQVARERAAEVAYTLSASVVEIYQEQIFDLLTGSKDTGDSLSVKEGPSGLYIPNLRIEAVSGPEDVAAVLQKGRQNRSTFATNMNEHSSRSHLVLSIYATAKHLTKDTTWSSKLHLIDLAGSERVSRSGAEGERLKEAAAINKSLSALGDVVSALQQRSGHVPYRNSKLTRLLEDSLGGSSKTLLVVNCSPAAENVAETKCSLDFATRARKVELGAAVRAGESSSGGGGAVGAAPSSQSGTSGGGRDSPINGSPSRPSQLCTSSGPSAGGGSGSANSSPRVSGRYTGSGGHANELRQAAVTRRSWAVASTSQKEDK